MTQKSFPQYQTLSDTQSCFTNLCHAHTKQDGCYGHCVRLDDHGDKRLLWFHVKLKFNMDFALASYIYNTEIPTNSCITCSSWSQSECGHPCQFYIIEITCRLLFVNKKKTIFSAVTLWSQWNKFSYISLNTFSSKNDTNSACYWLLCLNQQIYSLQRRRIYVFIIQLFGVDKQLFLPSFYMQWHNEDKSKMIIS